MSLTPIPNDCPICGDAVKWACARSDIPSGGWPEGLEVPEGAAIFDFVVACHKQESRSFKSIHGTCVWGFTAIGTFTRSPEDPRRLSTALYLPESVKLNPAFTLAHRKYPEGRAVRSHEQSPVAFMTQSTCESALEPILRLLASDAIAQVYPEAEPWERGAAISALRNLAAILRFGAHPDALSQQAASHILHLKD